MTTRVLMVGDSLRQRGGIATLQRLHLAGAPTHVETTHVTTHVEGSLVRRMVVFVVALARITWHLSRRRIDLMHVHQSGGGSLVRKALVLRLAAWWSVPTVLHGHAGRSDSTLESLPAPLRRVVISSLGRADAAIALSNDWARWYHISLGIPESRIRTIHNPAPDVAHVAPPSDARERVRVLSVSRLREDKGTFDLVRAFAHLSDEVRRGVELVLVGDGELDALRVFADELGVSESLVLTGWLAGDDLDLAVASASIVVAPGPDEGLPLALLEAMAHGKATVSVAVGGASELIDHGRNGLLVPPRSPDAIAAALDELIVAGADRRIQMGRAALETCRANSVTHYWEALLEVYEVARRPDDAPFEEMLPGATPVPLVHRRSRRGVSIVVPTFNRASWLGGALASLSTQVTSDGGGLDLDLEIVVVDNASTDDTKQVILDAAATTDTPIRYVYEGVQGDGAARNAGIAQATHGLIAFFDDDQFADDRWVLELVRTLDSTGAMVVGGAVTLDLTHAEAARFGQITRRDMLRESTPYDTIRQYEPGSLPGTCNLLVDVAVFDDVGVFDADLNGGSDFDFLRRATRRGYALWHAPQALVTHRVSEYRRSAAYFRREASRNGWTLADETSLDAGSVAMATECVARLVHVAVWSVPKLLWAAVTRDAATLVDQRVVLWRTQGFVRRTVHTAAPSMWPQDEFIASHQFAGHESQQLAPESATAA